MKTYGELCCGCMACINVCPVHAIQRVVDEKGFYSVSVDSEVCINCGKCLSVCPIHYTQEERKPEMHEVQQIYAVQAKDGEKRLKSQSGGAYTLFAKAILEDQGILYGVSFEKNEAVYIRVDEINKLELLKGSKYIQANMGNVIEQVESDLADGRVVLYAGTPCYVEGLLKCLKEKRVRTSNLYTIDLVCHGVPSPGIFKDYLSVLENQYEEDVHSFNFRDKLFGWGDHVCSYKVNGKKFFSRDFVNIFYSSVCLNESCYVCRYSSMHRVSDITIGDYWGIKESYPDMDDNLGTSLVILNTEKGKELFECIKDKIVYQRTPASDCKQRNLMSPTEKSEKYDEFWQLYYERGFLKAVQEYCDYKGKEERWASELYESLCAQLEEGKINEVYLYGIGVTMMQILYHIQESNIDIKIIGLLDRNEKYVGRRYFGYEVVREQMLLDSEGSIVICSKSENNTSIILKRLQSKKEYENMKFVCLKSSWNTVEK